HSIRPPGLHCYLVILLLPAPVNYRRYTLNSSRSVRPTQLEDSFMYTRRLLPLIFTSILVPLLCTLFACGQTTTVAVVPDASATATLVPPTSTSTTLDVCPSPWENFPAFSTSVVSGMVPLPPKTRVIMVDSAPGEADATLCTQDAT